MKIDEIEIGEIYGLEATSGSRRGYPSALDIKVRVDEIVVQVERGYRGNPRNVRRVQVQLQPDPTMIDEGDGPSPRRRMIGDRQVGDHFVVDAASLWPWERIEEDRDLHRAHLGAEERLDAALGLLGLGHVRRTVKIQDDEITVRLSLDLDNLERLARTYRFAEGVVTGEGEEDPDADHDLVRTLHENLRDGSPGRPAIARVLRAYAWAKVGDAIAGAGVSDG